MTSIEASPNPGEKKPFAKSLNSLLPYGLAILIQLPMLMLYFRQLWNRPHYQPFAVAIIATVGLAIYRWPFDSRQPFHKSLIGDCLLVVGLCFAALAYIFVEPWFAAASAMFLATSLFTKTLDRETLGTLWPCSLPLFVYLMLPGGLDVRLITKLQQYSAVYTSRLLDLAGVGHHMNGTVIKIPGRQEYGIEQACSGIQSFFTLLLVAVIFVVASRRIKVPRPGVAILSLIGAGIWLFLRMNFIESQFWLDIFLMFAVGHLLFALIGFQSTALIMSAVFWAVFMNTLRILIIPLADHYFEIDLAHGMSHDMLGYAVLTLGIVLILSTDQFLVFLFGPVDPESGEAGPFGHGITKVWNNLLSGERTEEEEESARDRAERLALLRKPISNSGRTFVWTVAGLVLALGVFQFIDVQRSKAHPDLKVRFFDNEVMVDFGIADLDEKIGAASQPGGVWKRLKPDSDGYRSSDRTHGSDLGQRSDTWVFRSNNLLAVASLDQTFPGWHELTTCYQNQGWKLKPNSRKKILPDVAEGEKAWPFIEAEFEKPTGEQAYLVFSHFNAFAEGMNAPRDWGTINSFIIRAKNRMTHRIRAQLFQGEAYQTQVFTSSFNKFTPEQKEQVRDRYLLIREQMRSRFQEKRAAEQAAAN